MKILFVAATKKWRCEKGQSVVLIAMVILSFILFFSFAINTGVLITAKISVQAAADAAAYAGAATQARQLNAISYLNYDMRRQFKKFVYRYAFVGSVSAKGFPTEASPSDHYSYPRYYFTSEQSGSLTHTDVGVPVICIPLTGSTTENDNCVFLNQPNTSLLTQNYFPAGGLTSITIQLLKNIADIAEMQNNICAQNGGINLFVLTEWLFRGDIDPAILSTVLKQMTTKLNPQEAQKVEGVVSGMVDGLGLYPRNLINLMRIETLEKFLNEPAKKDLQKDGIAAMETAGNAEVNERTIQAFKSALSNLNNEVLKHETVTMQELQNDHQITINPVTASFNAYVQYIMPAGSSPTNDPTMCRGQITPFLAKKAPVGVVRGGNVNLPVHYAVKVSAKANLLFSPIKDGIELEAFASAKPFGSRIGPANLSENDFVEVIKPKSPVAPGFVPITDCNDATVGCNAPNLKITGQTNFYTPAYLQALGVFGISQSGTGKSYTGKGLAQAMAPQPEEIGRYNILPPYSQNMAAEFISYANAPTSRLYRFYAPIFPAGGADLSTRVNKFMDEIFGTTQVSGNNQFQVDMMAIKDDLKNHLIAYLQGPVAGGGSLSENGETQTFAALELPMANSATLGPSGPKYWLTSANEVLTSWGPDFTRISDSDAIFKPRFGYSVKFVAMQNLLQAGSLGPDDDQSKLAH